MPIVNGKYQNPQWRNGGPPALDADELNAISDTLQELSENGSGGGDFQAGQGISIDSDTETISARLSAQQGNSVTFGTDGGLYVPGSGAGGDGKRYARFVIGTSTNGWTAADCDYLCDGVDDQETFLDAINALPTDGGEIKVLDGTYNFTSDLNFPSKETDFYVLFSGCGDTTRINFGTSVFYLRQYPIVSQFTILFDNISLLNPRFLSTAEGCLFFRRTYIENPSITATYMQILVNDCDIYIESVDGIPFYGTSNDPPSAFYNSRFVVNSSNNTTLLSSNTNTGVFSGNYVLTQDSVTTTLSCNGTITGNFFNGVRVSAIGGNACGNLLNDGSLTVLNGSATGNVIVNGNIQGSEGSSICGNHISVSDSADAGIVIYKSAYEQHKPLIPKTVSGNTVLGGAYGIFLENAASSMADKDSGNVLVSGNSCDSTVPLQIESEWHDCLITGNMFPNGAIVDNGTSNTKVNNITGS